MFIRLFTIIIIDLFSDCKYLIKVLKITCSIRLKSFLVKISTCDYLYLVKCCDRGWVLSNPYPFLQHHMTVWLAL